MYEQLFVQTSGILYATRSAKQPFLLSQPQFGISHIVTH